MIVAHEVNDTRNLLVVVLLYRQDYEWFLAENKVIYLDIHIREQTSPSFSSVLDLGTIGKRSQIKFALSPFMR